jgi:hypothetical protein
VIRAPEAAGKSAVPAIVLARQRVAGCEDRTTAGPLDCSVTACHPVLERGPDR